MPSLRGPVGVFVLLWAALQLAVPGVAAIADSFAARDGAAATAHVEDTARSNCVRVHDSECVFCQVLSTCFTATGSPVPDAISTARASVARAPINAPSLDNRRRALLPRAPPLA